MQIKEYITSVETLTSLFKSLGDETRIRIINLLREGELCVCHMEKVLEQPQSKISRHLFLLKAAGVAKSKRNGHWVFYSLADNEDYIAMLNCLWRTIGANQIFNEDKERLKQLKEQSICQVEE